MSTTAWDHPAATGARNDNTFGLNASGTFKAVPTMTPSSLTGVTAFPATAWASGKYIRLATGALMHWSGTAWVAGAA